MRIESSVISISWIPSEAIKGAGTRVPFEMGIAHYDAPLPETVDDLDALRRADAFRFANELRAWIEVEDGRVVGHGHLGQGHIGSTTLRLGRREATFEAVALPDLRPDPVVTPTSVRFVQTAGGRTGVPAPRRVRRKPFVQFRAPLAWTTLALTVHADVACRRGALADAEAEAREALALADDHGLPWAEPLAIATLLEALGEQARGADADAVLAERELSEWQQGGARAAVHLHARGRLRLAQDRPADALADFRGAGEIMRRYGVDHPAAPSGDSPMRFPMIARPVRNVRMAPPRNQRRARGTSFCVAVLLAAGSASAMNGPCTKLK